MKRFQVRVHRTQSGRRWMPVLAHTAKEAVAFVKKAGVIPTGVASVDTLRGRP
jgi:hypothetical protein